MKKAYLILENGDVYEGTSIGVSGESVGEVVFTTGMGSYMETLTDPCYYGQIIAQTFPLIGNYGAITPETESKKSYCKGYIVRELCRVGSNFRLESELEDWLIANNVVGIEGIDTRRLTKTLRECGVMNGMITPTLARKAEKLEIIKAYKVKDAIKNTASAEKKTVGEGKRVALINYGALGNIAQELTSRGCEVTVFPSTATAEDVLSINPLGIVLSDGAGNPAEAKAEVEQITKLNEAKIPTFGISLGHQLMALACGAKTGKLKYGHRGASQPVKDLEAGKVRITAQNHGYVVRRNSLSEEIGKATMINLNDKSIEAIEYLDRPCYTVQFAPDSADVDKFVKMIEEVRNA